ncbi:MAG: hypothetical protein KJ958_08025 [Gammaproteobacteria bacterium]|nr:hypothetical protein [Gammaproteobacteria bacterium]
MASTAGKIERQLRRWGYEAADIFMANALWAAMVNADSVVVEVSGNQLQVSNSWEAECHSASWLPSPIKTPLQRVFYDLLE